MRIDYGNGAGGMIYIIIYVASGANAEKRLQLIYHVTYTNVKSGIFPGIVSRQLSL